MTADRTPLPELPYHPCANIMPMMGAEDRAALKSRMAREGYNKAKPLVLLDGQVLDGRNRYEVARELGLTDQDVTFRIFGEPDEETGHDWADGDDPLEFVLRENYDRRHLSVSQRALVIAEAEKLRHGGRRLAAEEAAAQAANLHLDLPDAPPAAPAQTRADLAERGGVSERSVATAAIVRDQGVPELKDAVRDGKVAISTAADIATLPQAEQKEVVARGEQEILAKAKAIRKDKQQKKHVERQQKGEAIAKNNPGLPGRLYPLALIDVPRKHNVYDDVTGAEKSPDNHYPTMTFRELVDFPIDSFLAKDAIIVFDSTAASALDDLEILAEWGFVAFRPRDAGGKLVRDEAGEPLAAVGGGQYGSEQIWHKQRTGEATGMGRWFRDMHEKVIVARRGDVPAPLPGTQDVSCFLAPWDGHSVKPRERVRAWIDRCWPYMEKIELFARAKPGEAPPEGWTFWGNQVEPALDLGIDRAASEATGQPDAAVPAEARGAADNGSVSGAASPPAAPVSDGGNRTPEVSGVTSAASEQASPPPAPESPGAGGDESQASVTTEEIAEYLALEALDQGNPVDAGAIECFAKEGFIVSKNQTRLTSAGYGRRNELEAKLGTHALGAKVEDMRHYNALKDIADGKVLTGTIVPELRRLRYLEPGEPLKLNARGRARLEDLGKSIGGDDNLDIPAFLHRAPEPA